MVSKRSEKAVSSQPEEISIIARIGESIKVPTTKSGWRINPRRQLNLENITSLDDLKSIQQQDPFMYYSIPGVRSAKVLMRDIDVQSRRRSSPQNGATTITESVSKHLPLI